MKTLTTPTTKIFYVLSIALCVILAGCSQSDNGDDPDNPDFKKGIPTEVRFTLCSRADNRTRADGGRPKDPNASVERIHNWWLAFVDIEGDGNVTVKKRPGGSLTDGIEVETFNIIIPTGHYNIYAFANIDLPTPSQSVDATLSEDEKAAKAIEELLDSDHKITGMGLESIIGPNKFTDDMRWSKESNIPMTGFIEGAWVRNTVEEAFSIEVIRAVAKIEFTFTNPTDDVITLKDLTFGPITKTDVSLFPQYSALGYEAYSPFVTADEPTAYGFSNVELKGLTTGENPELDYKTLVKNVPWNYYFYCKESLAPSATAAETDTEPAKKKGLFTITLTVNKNSSETDEPKRTFYTSVVKDYINRNDWINIPIRFNDWTIYWKLHYYPPIGGYPPVFEQNADGSSMSATLTTGGEFELYPYMIKQNNDPENKDYSNYVDWDNTDMKVELESGDPKIFVGNTLPKTVDNPGNSGNHPILKTEFPKIIMGELDPKEEGTAQLKIIFYLKDTPVSGTKLDCTFTINRQNEAPTDSDGNDDNTET